MPDPEAVAAGDAVAMALTPPVTGPLSVSCGFRTLNKACQLAHWEMITDSRLGFTDALGCRLECVECIAR